MTPTLSESLTAWYETHKRDLPWRRTSDPYRIWISEIILQQTRVAQGEEYYLRFIERFPDVRTLAEAREEEVLKYWQGLGYYSRARNLHAAAREIMERFGGKFPETYAGVSSLRGIGPYTAAAVCSIAYGLPYATVDGNVYRVLSRLFGIDTPIDSTKGQKEFAALARSLLDERRAGLHNQALMEFGALHCTPRSPGCVDCPVAERCRARQERKIDVLPVKQGKNGVIPRYFHYLDIAWQGKRFLKRRDGKDIWQGLFEFPLIETVLPVPPEELLGSDDFKNLLPPETKPEITGIRPMPVHQLSHRTIHACFYRIRIGRLPASLKSYTAVTDAEIGDLAVSRLTELYLESGPDKKHLLKNG